MKWSRSHIPTLRDPPQEAEVISHKLMLRAGMIRKVASGIYSYLPLGQKVISKIEQIIREEMNRSGAQEVSLPIVQPKELWEESGRWGYYGKELARFQDRHENDFCLQPTSEEAIVDLVRKDLKSYRQLPMNLYQIQTKFRDEIRPRFGLMRGREFIMKDAYSFDLDMEAAFQSYEEMRLAYRRIFTRAGLKFKPVDADTGTIGGTKSEEFTVLAESGEDEIVSCVACTYGANQEKADGKAVAAANKEIPGANLKTVEKFATPGLKSIEELAVSLKVTASNLVKTMIATDSEQRCIVVLLRGDHEIHEVKLSALLSLKLQLKGVRLASDQELKAWQLPKGSLGPVNFPVSKALVVMDSAINLESKHIVGANEEGFHLKGVDLKRDAKVDLVGSIRRVTSGEKCLNCGADLQLFRGIEVGHVFYLGQKYSKAMKLEYTTEDGKAQTVEMGCYGIGVGRTMAACIEQNHDQNGLIWPLPLAPYEVSIVSLGEAAEVERISQNYYEALLAEGIDVIWDDRKLSPGVKLKDSDLIGIPYQLIVGDRGLQKNEVEWKIRRDGSRQMLPAAEAKSLVVKTILDERESQKKKALVESR